MPAPEVFLLFRVPSPGGSGRAIAGADDPSLATPVIGWQPHEADWIRFPLGVEESLRQRSRRQQSYHNLKELLDVIRDLLRHFGGMIRSPISLHEISQDESITVNDLLPRIILEFRSRAAGDGLSRELFVPGSLEPSRAGFSTEEAVAEPARASGCQASEHRPQTIMNWKLGAVVMMLAAIRDLHRASPLAALWSRRKQWQCQVQPDEPVAD
jgi:hypothetical protein